MTAKKKIGDMLIEQGQIDKYQLKAALNRQERWGKKLGETLLEMGFITEDTLIKTLSMIFNIPSIKPEKFEITKKILALIPRDVCERLLLIPLAVKVINNKKRLVVAMSDPTNFSAVDEVQFLTNMRVLPMVTSISNIRTTIIKYFGAPAHNEAGSNPEISIISKVSKPGEYMEIIRDGKEERISVDKEESKEKVFKEIQGRVDRAKPKGSDFEKALEEKLSDFDIEETQEKPQPLADYEYEESTGVFKEDSIFNKLVKILKSKSVLTDQELKVLLGVTAKESGKGLKDSRSLKILVELLFEKNLINASEKKLLEED